MASEKEQIKLLVPDGLSYMYSKLMSELDEKINASKPKYDIQVVDAVPAEAAANTIYLVKEQQ